MSTVQVKLATNPYAVVIENGLHEQIGQAVAAVWTPRKVLIVTDANVAPSWLADTRASLQTAGFNVFTITLAPGEASKTLAGAASVYDALIQHAFSRTDGIITLGGGVITDLGGFAAATFMRGIALINIPTTLLAEVDASVGGKTAINMGTGKNLVGAFYQPDRVLIDPAYLSTLSTRNLVEGYGEVVKMAAMDADPAFWELITSINSPADLLAHTQPCIERAVAAKAAIVAQDVQDNGTRQLLNLGHTIGHAIELTTPDTRHGEAVSMGLLAIVKLGVRWGITASATVSQIEDRLQAVGLPTVLPPISAQELMHRIRLDKKVRGDRITLVLLEKLGKPQLHTLTLADLAVRLAALSE